MFLIRHQGGGGQVINPEVLKEFHHPSSDNPPIPLHIPLPLPHPRQHNLSLAVALSRKTLEVGDRQRLSGRLPALLPRLRCLTIPSPPLRFSCYRRCNHPEWGDGGISGGKHALSSASPKITRSLWIWSCLAQYWEGREVEGYGQIEGAWARERSRTCRCDSDTKDVEFCRRASCRFSVFSCLLCFAQISFCCCRCSQVLADTVESESFKQLHLDTQLTHSIDFFRHQNFFVSASTPLALFIFSKYAVQLGGHCLKSSEALLRAAWPD